MPFNASLLTADDLAPLEALLHQMLALQQASAQPVDDYLSIDQVAAETGHSRKTVTSWVEEGKFGAGGHRVKLFTLEFQPGYRRIPRSALLAYGQGLPFEAAQLTLPPAAAPVVATRRRVLDSTKALRKAS